MEESGGIWARKAMVACAYGNMVERESKKMGSTFAPEVRMWRRIDEGE